MICSGGRESSLLTGRLVMLAAALAAGVGFEHIGVRATAAAGGTNTALILMKLKL